MQEMYERMENEKQEVVAQLNSQKLTNKKQIEEIKSLKDELAKEKAISKQMLEKDEKYAKLQSLFNLKETEYNQNIDDLKNNYEKQLTEKANQIAFLRKKVSQTVQELQAEIQQRNLIIKEKVEEVRKQRNEDLKTFIETKEELERKMQDEKDSILRKYKERIQMDLEFKAFQYYGIKEVENEEISQKLESEK